MQHGLYFQKTNRPTWKFKTSYGSDHKLYGCVKKDINVATKYLTDIQERLSGVVIENKDFEDLLKVYDKEDALVYLDPPYYGTERYYQNKFSKGDHIRLSDYLKNVKGKFILSYNDCEFIRDLYKNFNIDEVQRNHNLVGKYSGRNHKYSELIIRNY
ncbi:Modification methylase DpnIIA [Clostridium ljungdahlii DSM 13528]|uniref:site-specific DNA-methyltransferase (adenine-specific) n=1 Tax=Clostridium ljungdahlii (strain ATCC 55383 / DSM 13528 / PETC) TaxID=748727 RepID=D8GQ55_CLOLD|nr:hypothetical protein CLJU_c30980 [Clostridium ljungdahlii DSM 13528]OAA82661.1 Modification methylase DpnIIA [Clostridium ljungdahlii DSM 13528]